MYFNQNLIKIAGQIKFRELNYLSFSDIVHSILEILMYLLQELTGKVHTFFTYFSHIS